MTPSILLLLWQTLSRFRPVLGTLFSLVHYAIALTLLYSGLVHYAMQYQFYKSVIDYDLFPTSFDVVVAKVFPSAEIAIAISLLTPCLQPIGRVLAIVAFSGFSILHWVTLLRGRTISCGCFGSESDPISLRTAICVTLVALFLVITRGGVTTESLVTSQ